MKRLLALLLACLLLVLTACGTRTEDAANAEPSELTAEELPESCRRWFDIADSSGTAEPYSKLPFAEKGHDCTSEIYGVHMPDGNYTDLILREFQTEGVTVAEFSNGGAKVETNAGRLAWNGERYNAFTISARDCAIPNLMPVTGGLLRLDISGDCTIDGGGEPCFKGFDCVLLTGDGTLTCPTLWLQNAALVVKGDTLHVTGDCSIEKGSVTVEGGTLILDSGLWLGEGDVTVAGGEIVVPGGKDALCLDKGRVTINGGTIREP